MVWNAIFKMIRIMPKVTEMPIHITEHIAYAASPIYTLKRIKRMIRQ